MPDPKQEEPSNENMANEQHQMVEEQIDSNQHHQEESQPPTQEQQTKQPEASKNDDEPDQTPSDAELKLKEDAENAKTKLIEEIKNFKVADNQQEEHTEEEDPRV